MDTDFDPLGFVDDGEDNLEITYLVFRVAGEQYAVAVQQVTEIVRLQPIAPLPDVPPYILGVITLRGRVVPIMNMHLRCGLEPVEYNERTVIVVIEVGNKATGLVVEAVSEVIEIPNDQIGPPPPMRSKESMILGLGQCGDNVVIVVDCEKLLFGNEPLANNVES